MVYRFPGWPTRGLAGIRKYSQLLIFTITLNGKLGKSPYRQRRHRHFSGGIARDVILPNYVQFRYPTKTVAYIWNFSKPSLVLVLFYGTYSRKLDNYVWFQARNKAMHEEEARVTLTTWSSRNRSPCKRLVSGVPISTQRRDMMRACRGHGVRSCSSGAQSTVGGGLDNPYQHHYFCSASPKYALCSSVCRKRLSIRDAKTIAYDGSTAAPTTSENARQRTWRV